MMLSYFEDVFIVFRKLLALKIKLGILFISCLCFQALATTYRDMSLENMLSKAEIAFHGVVEDVKVESRSNEPWTIVTFEVRQALLGSLEESIELAFYGGASGSVVLDVTGIPKFTRAEEVIILAYNSDYYSPIVGFSQGLWRFRGRGFENGERQLLGLDEEGNLILDDQGADTEEILAAFTKVLSGDNP